MRRVVSVVLMVVLMTGVHAMGKAEPVTLTGVLSLKGNVPFSYLCLTDAEGRNWKLRVPADLPLGTQIGQTVTVVVRALAPRPTGPTPYPPEVEVTGIGY